MHSRMTPAVFYLALSIVVSSRPLSTPSSGATGSPPDLSGAWTLDRAHSDTHRGGMGAPRRPEATSAIETSRGTRQEQDLLVRSSGPGGQQVTQTYSLGPAGQTMNVATHAEASGDRPAVEFTRVYRKAKGR